MPCHQFGYVTHLTKRRLQKATPQNLSDLQSCLWQ